MPVHQPRYDYDKKETEEYYYKHKKPEPVCCSHFGCGRVLTRREQLHGDRCVHHQRPQIRDQFEDLELGVLEDFESDGVQAA